MSLDEPVQGPLDGAHGNIVLTSSLVGGPKLKHTENQVGGTPSQGVGALQVI